MYKKDTVTGSFTLDQMLNELKDMQQKVDKVFKLGGKTPDDNDNTSYVRQALSDAISAVEDPNTPEEKRTAAVEQARQAFFKQGLTEIKHNKQEAGATGEVKTQQTRNR